MSNYWKIGILGVLVTALIVGFVLLPGHPAVPVLPVPNGYDDLLKASQVVVSDGRRSYDDASDAVLRELIAANRAALELARRGFKRDCLIVLKPDRKSWMNHGNVQNRFKLVARAFLAEGLLAERDGRSNDAARSYLDGIRFARVSYRGGSVIDRLIGLACEATVATQLGSVVPALDAQTCRESCRIIETLDAATEPWETTFYRNRAWANRISTPRERVSHWALTLARLWKGEANPDTRWEQHVDNAALKLRALVVRLAKRAYRLENGIEAHRWTDLVPRYLGTIPKDPFTGKEMSLE